MGVRELWLVRHGESVANVAAAVADRDGADRIVVEYRDADVPLSETGERQAAALGGWLAENLPAGRVPAVWVSPYLRARQTAAIALERAGSVGHPSVGHPSDGLRVDERLRDRELGILDLLTSRGVDALLPEEAARRRWLGKFYYRPPGGESWADVALRVRSLLGDLDSAAGDSAAGDSAAGDSAASDGPVLIAAHDAVVMLFLYVCTGLTEEQLLDFARTHTVTNASVTRLVRPTGSGLWTLDLFSHDEHVEASGVPVTEHSGDTDARIH